MRLTDESSNHLVLLASTYSVFQFQEVAAMIFQGNKILDNNSIGNLTHDCLKKLSLYNWIGDLIQYY